MIGHNGIPLPKVNLGKNNIVVLLIIEKAEEDILVGKGVSSVDNVRIV